MDSKLKTVNAPSLWPNTSTMLCNTDAVEAAFTHCFRTKLHRSKHISDIVLVFLLLNLNK